MPVLTTKGAPWRELDTHACAWWTDVSADAIATALEQATQTSRADLDAMGTRGQALVRNRTGWADAARQMIAVYEWTLGRGSRPACVHLGGRPARRCSASTARPKRYVCSRPADT